MVSQRREPKEMNAFMISCKYATELIEKNQSTVLSLSEIFQLHFHTFMCDVCKRYERQSVFLEKILHREADRAGQARIDENAEKRGIERILKILS
jgi:hypothetical protein